MVLLLVGGKCSWTKAGKYIVYSSRIKASSMAIMICMYVYMSICMHILYIAHAFKMYCNVSICSALVAVPRTTGKLPKRNLINILNPTTSINYLSISQLLSITRGHRPRQSCGHPSSCCFQVSSHLSSALAFNSFYRAYGALNSTPFPGAFWTQ